MAIPGLPRGNRSRVFRRVCDQLQTDPALSSLVKRWRTFRGTEWDKVPANAMTETDVMLQPTVGPGGWYHPGGQIAPLVINIWISPPGAALGTTPAEDYLDIVELMERALYPADRARRNAFRAELVKLGAETGEPLFINPPSPIQGQDGELVLAGAMSIQVRRDFNP